MAVVRRTPPPGDIMSVSVYDSGGTGRVDNASNTSDGVNISSAAEIRESIDRNLVLTGMGNPNGIITGYIGQTYKDLTNNKFYACQADASTSWNLIGG